MVVGPEFGPLAGFCVAAVSRRRDVALRSFRALAVGFPVAITAVFLSTVVFRATGLMTDELNTADHQLAEFISSPDFFAFFVAACAGIAGVLSLSTAKSGALIGVLISVTTIPAAANVGVAAAYQDWDSWRGSLFQLLHQLRRDPRVRDARPGDPARAVRPPLPPPPRRVPDRSLRPPLNDFGPTRGPRRFEAWRFPGCRRRLARTQGTG